MSSSLLTLLCLGFAPTSIALAEEGWDEWKAVSKGFVARRKIPRKHTEYSGLNNNSDLTSQNATSLRQVQEAQQFFATVEALNTGDTVDAVWLKTKGEGLFSVSISELASLTGRVQKDIITSASRRRLTLTNDGQVVRWLYYPDTESILFVGQEYDDFYTDINAYHLTFGRTRNSKRINITRSDNGPDGGVENPFLESLKYEEEPNLFFDLGHAVAAEADIDYWFWDYLQQNNRESIIIPIAVPNPAEQGVARITINMRGATDLLEGNDHQVTATLNGEQLTLNGQIIDSTVIWDGFTDGVLEIEFDQDILINGENTLGLAATYFDNTLSSQYLDDIQLEYHRQPVVDNGSLFLSELPLQVEQRVTGFSSEEIIVIQNPNGTPVARRDVSIFDEGDGTYSVAFDTKNSSEYLVSQVDAIVSSEIQEDTESDLSSSANNVDYLIIAPRDFAGAAGKLLNFHASNFSNRKIAWLDDIYDEFSAGRVDPYAIAEFLNFAQSSWSTPPSYVVLLGKGTIDHKNRMGLDDSFVPIVMTETPFALVASDDRLLAGDNLASFSIGRIPIISNAEGEAYVDKLTEYVSQATNPEKFNAVLVADNADEAGDFVTNSEQLAVSLSNDYGFSDLQEEYHPSTPAVTDQMRLDATWNAGLVSYDGHGSFQQAGKSTGFGEDFIHANRVVDLSNTTYPIFSSLTCSAGNFTFPGADRSLATSLVLNPTGGAIAAYSPTGFSLDRQAQIMHNEFLSSLYGGASRIGQSALDAKLNSDGTQNFMRRMYSIIGDPAVYAR